MIDGAHLLTPGVLRHGMLGLSTYAPAVVTARQWYVGPGQQPDTLAGGLRQRVRGPPVRPDRLAGRRLPAFEIGHFIGDARLVRRRVGEQLHLRPPGLIDQVGGMDESFSTPGGGFVNLDLFERMVSSPGSLSSRCSARARSTRSTAERPPTSPTPRSAAT